MNVLRKAGGKYDEVYDEVNSGEGKRWYIDIADDQIMQETICMNGLHV